MANIAAYNNLQTFATTTYPTPQSLGITGARHPGLPSIGERINPKYMHSSTPLQVKRAIDISCLVLSILASAALITAAILLRNGRIFYGLIATGVGAAVSGGFALHHFSLIDLDSPKVRDKETQMLRSHKLGLSEINKRYDGFSNVASYALLGKGVPETTYQQGADLALRQDELDTFHQKQRGKIASTYDDTIRPARAAANAAQMADFFATIQATDRRNPYPLTSTINLIHTTVASSEAFATLRDVEAQVSPVYKKAIGNLNEGYNREATANEVAFQQLPLDVAAPPAQPSAPPADDPPPSYAAATATLV